jgi:predicted molibdopterin-dependent oxidoreductase YjgC
VPEAASIDPCGIAVDGTPTGRAMTQTDIDVVVAAYAEAAAAAGRTVDTVFDNKPELMRRAGAPEVLLHPDGAAGPGITDGAPVLVRSEAGAFHATARLTDRTSPGVVLTTKGRWPKHSPGGAVNATVPEEDSGYGGGAMFHDNRVRIEAVEVLPEVPGDPP